MPLSIDKAFGIHERALLLKGQRSEILASNLANVDTPNYKARDIDFKEALDQAQQLQHPPLKTTHDKHIGSSASAVNSELLYRIPEQPSLDGNTVDARVEQAEFVENALQYQTSIRFLSDKIQGLRSAIKGE
jgi:flagellar basal-body rod protein FlgB